MIANKSTQPAPSDPDVIVYGRLALACGIVSFVGLVAWPIICAQLLSRPVSDLPQRGVLGHLGAILWIAGLVGIVAGWYFVVCGYIAHGPKGSWRLGCTALVLMIVATVLGWAMMCED